MSILRNPVPRQLVILMCALSLGFLPSVAGAYEGYLTGVPTAVPGRNEICVLENGGLAIQKPYVWKSPDSLGLSHGEHENLSPAGGSGSLAEIYLGRVAEKSKHARTMSGVGCLILGTGTIVLGAAIVGDEVVDNSQVVGGALLGFGVVVDAVSLWLLSTPSRAERELDNVLGITNLERRERVGHEVLVSLAEGARTNRILEGVSCAIASGYFFMAQPYKTYEGAFGWGYSTMAEESSPLNFAMGASYGALSLYYLMTKSTEEKALQRYLEESKQGQQLGLRLGVDPFGKGRIALSFSF